MPTKAAIVPRAIFDLRVGIDVAKWTFAIAAGHCNETISVRLVDGRAHCIWRRKNIRAFC